MTAPAGYESVWNGGALLTPPERPPAETAADTRCCRGCFERKPLAAFRTPRGYKCLECIKRQTAERLQRYRTARRTAKLCVRCGKRRAVKATICYECRKRERGVGRRYRERLSAERRCRNCRAELLPSWRQNRCSKCLREEALSAKAVREARRAAGICYRCGRGPVAKAPDGRPLTSCRPCLDKASARVRARTRRKQKARGAG